MESTAVKNYKEEISKRLSENLKKIIYKKKLSNQDVIDLINDKHEILINPGTMANTVNGKSLPPFYIITLIAEAIGCSINELVQVEDKTASEAQNNLAFFRDIFTTDEHLHLDPACDEFTGVLGKFYCYFLPTFSNPNQPHLGIMEFTVQGNLCKAHFILHTGQKLPNSDEEHIKEYVGILAVAKSVDSCFCLLKGHKNISTGEICFLSFRCLHLNKQMLECSIAEVVTISAGNSKRVPTAHRMLLTRKKINQEHFSFIMPSLYLNTSRFLIREDALINHTSFTEGEKLVLDMLNKTEPVGRYYFFTEREIKGFADRVGLTDGEKNLLINKLRSVSEKEKYNKASAEANDIIWSILKTLDY